MNRHLFNGIFRGMLAAYALCAVAVVVLLSWFLWKAIHLPPSGESPLLQVWDGFLFIVREIGKAWRGQ